MHSTDIFATCFPFAYLSCATGLAYSYVSFPVSHVSLLYRYGLSTHLCLLFHLTHVSFWLVDSSEESLFPDLRLLSSYECLYLYLPTRYIYGWGWGLVPHLQSTLQPPYKCDYRDPTNSLSSLLAHWPRLLLCDLYQRSSFASVC